ncbi:hypothetical protein B0H13DRAFT_1896580 [Mycena leptocephala]|nr:hypothetical protein B0H13DRAFT_1896580 [Mycena leptocephala]
MWENADFHLRDLEAILTALELLDKGPTIYAQACADAGIKPIYHPFWEGLPYTNIFQAISAKLPQQLGKFLFSLLLPPLHLRLSTEPLNSVTYQGNENELEK